MLAATLAFVLTQNSLSAESAADHIVRDNYGVPQVQGATWGEAFYWAGYAVAQDRLWQMEMSRRLVRGRLAAVMGERFAAADREALRTRYTDEELETQISHLTPAMRQALDQYVRGVNAWIERAMRTGLPEGYAQNGFSPEPWTTLDSAAISIHLMQQFGRGGAGELRNMALMAYLRTLPKLKNRVLDTLDDFAWFNDPRAIPTVAPGDDAVKIRPSFPVPDRRTSERRLASLPNVGMFDLLKAVAVAEHRTSTQVAESLAVPFETGSYCVVVDGHRSATGRPLLLSGPQMGFRTPSIVHEMSIKAPGLAVAGMDVPGVPGVLIGATRDVTWGLTSGVADTDDIFFYPTVGDRGYRYGTESRTLTRLEFPLAVKGGATETVVQERTDAGPVVLRSAGARTLFANRTAAWMRELESLNALSQVWAAKTAPTAVDAMSAATMNFNFFCASDNGQIGYRYTGLVPVRAPGLDPRFPTPGRPEDAWRGMISPDSMPHALNPRAGFFANWNNKPVAWWPNGDTPDWGAVFHNAVVLKTLTHPLLTAQDLEQTAWTIAREDDTWTEFAPYLRRAMSTFERNGEGAKLEPIRGFDGRLVHGSRQAAAYRRFVSALRSELFLGTTGNFLSPDYFALVAQPSVMWRALRRETRIDYLAGRPLDEVLHAALSKALAGGPFVASGIAVPGQPPIPYADRGTYIQIVESLADGMIGRNILPPGVAASGPNALNQVAMARAWLYKPMPRPWSP